MWSIRIQLLEEELALLKLNNNNSSSSSSFIPPGTEVMYSDIIAATNIKGTDAYINISPALLPNQYISDVIVSFEENFAASDSSTDVDFNIYDATNSVDLCMGIAGACYAEALWGLTPATGSNGGIVPDIQKLNI